MVATRRSKGSTGPTPQLKNTSSSRRAKKFKPVRSTTESNNRTTTKPVFTAQTDQIRSTLYTFLTNLRENSTICPSQVARRMHEAQPGLYPNWRALMDPVREVVWDEVQQGRAEVTQGGVVRGLEKREGLRGPIRVRRGKGFKRAETEVL